MYVLLFQISLQKFVSFGHMRPLQGNDNLNVVWSIWTMGKLSDPQNFLEMNFCQQIGSWLLSQDWQAHYGNADFFLWEFIPCDCTFTYVNEEAVISKSEHLSRCARYYLIIRTVWDWVLLLIFPFLPSFLFPTRFLSFFLDFPPSFLCPSFLLLSLSIKDKALLRFRFSMAEFETRILSYPLLVVG